MRSRYCSPVFLSLLAALFANVDALCNLCSNGVSGLRRPDHYLDGHGTTCVSKALEMAAISEFSSQCSAEINSHRSCCCDVNAQCTSIDQPPTAPPVYRGPFGNYPPCDICKGRGRVSNTAMVINMLYIGTGTCSQYYDYGLAGLIQTHMCDPLQHYAYEPCGCGEFGDRWDPSQQAPGNSNTNGSTSSGNGSDNSNSSGNDVLPERKNPNSGFQSKEGMKFGQNRGGSGGGQSNGGGRYLKGSKV